MFSAVLSISSLLLGICTVLVGVSLLATSLGVRASIEHFPDSLTGLIMAGYFIGFIAGSFACPPIIRRIGHIRSFTVFAAVAASAAYGHDIFVHPVAWFVLRLVTGIAIVGIYIIIESWINANSPKEQHSHIFSIYMTTTLLAMAVGPYLILLKPAFSFGIAAILLTLGLLPVALTRVVEPKQVAEASLHIKTLYHTSHLGMVGATMSGFANGAFLALGAVFAQKIGLSTTQIALFMSLMVIGGATLQWPLGRLSNHGDRRVVLILVSFAAAVLAAGAYLLSGYSHLLMLVVMFFYGGMTFAVYPLSVAHVNDRTHDGDSLDAAQGILLMYGFGAIGGPIVAGLAMGWLGAKGLLLFFSISYLGMGLYAWRRRGATAAAVEEDKTEFVPMARSSQAALEMHPEVEQEG
jgi:MFS family permease